MRPWLRAVAVLAVVSLAGCGGGHSAPVSPSAAVAPSNTTPTAPLTIIVQLPQPGTAAAKRAPQYVSSATTEMLVFVVPNGSAFTGQPFQSVTCTTTCQTTVNVPVGSLHLQIDLANSTSPTTYLSFSDVVVQVYPGIANSINFGFDGQPVAVTLTKVSGPSSFTPGVPATITYNVTLQDAAGKTIGGQGLLWNPVTLASSPTSGISVTPSLLDAGVVATNSTGSATNNLTVAYDGSTISRSSVTITASGQNGLGTNITMPVNGATAGLSIPVSGTAPAPSATSAVGVNVATQQSSSGVWLGYVPSTVTVSSGVAVSLQLPVEFPTTAPTPASLTMQLNGGLAPFSVSQRVPQTLPAPPIAPPPADHPPTDPNMSALRAVGIAAGSQGTSSHVRRPLQAVGTTQNFSINKFAIGTTTSTYVSVPFKLEARTAHGQIWIDQTTGTAAASISTATLNQLATEFETAWSEVTTNFASNNYQQSTLPGAFDLRTCTSNGTFVSNVWDEFPIPDPGYTNVFITDQTNMGAGVGGYNSGSDFFPQDTENCYGNVTNGGPAIYVGWFQTQDATSLGATAGLAYATTDAMETMAHEFLEVTVFIQHAILRGGDNEPFDIQDGMAQVSQSLVRGNGSHPRWPSYGLVYNAAIYLANPQNYSFTSFAGFENGGYSTACSGCYGQAFLFMSYLVDRFGMQILTKLAQSPQANLANVAAATGETPQQLMQDFATELAISGTGITSSILPATQALPLRTAFTDADGDAWTASQLTPHPVFTLSSTAQTTSIYPGAFAFFALPAPGANGSTVKVTDATGTLSLWLGLDTK